MFGRPAAILGILAVALLAVPLAACATDRSAAERFAAQYFDAIRVHDIDRAMSMYSPVMLDTAKGFPSLDQWRSIHARVQERLGDLDSYRLTGWKVTQYVGTVDPSGAYYALQYETKYSRNTISERVTVFIPVGGSFKDAKLVGHILDHRGLLD